MGIFEHASLPGKILRTPHPRQEQNYRKPNHVTDHGFRKALPGYVGIEKDLAPERHRLKAVCACRGGPQRVSQIIQKDAMRWFQFHQQAQAVSRVGVAAYLGTGGSGQSRLWFARYTIHVRPVVFALCPAATTHLVIASVGRSQRPEKLVDADARHKSPVKGCRIRAYDRK